eukprot:scaffold80041_cov17-Prasinocladus_malaysianus.AAC.1
MDVDNSTSDCGNCWLSSEQENVTSPTFWTNAFVLRRGGSPTTDSNDASCIPCFLKEVTCRMLAFSRQP